MIRAPDTFDAPPLSARRIQAADLAFVQSLMALPQMHLHKPDPTIPLPDAIAWRHEGDLDAWDRLGFGRYILRYADQEVGLCGLSRRPELPGVNLSYHLSPHHWGRGWASAVAAALVDLATGLDLPGDARVIYGLVRPANPASARVLVKSGFRRAGLRDHDGAPTEIFVRDLSAAS